MQLSLKILASLLTLIFLALGLSAFLNPAEALAGPAFAWSPDGIAGLSAGRGILGGQYLALALVSVYALVKSDYRFLYVPALAEFMIVLGRLLSLGIDGFDERSLMPLIVEAIIAAGMFCSARFLGARAAVS